MVQCIIIGFTTFLLVLPSTFPFQLDIHAALFFSVWSLLSNEIVGIGYSMVMVDMVNGDEVLALLIFIALMVQHVRIENWFGWNASVR